MERVLHQTEQGRPWKIYFCLRKDKKVRSLFWQGVAGRLGFLYHETKTYRTGLHILWPQDCGMQPNYTINFIEKAIATKVQEDLNREAGCEDRTKQALPATVTPKQRTDHCWNG